MLLRPANRHASAVTVLIPLVAVALLGRLPGVMFSGTGVPEPDLETLSQIIFALGTGMAALWLLAPEPAWNNRFLIFLGTLAVAGISSLLVFAVTAFPLSSPIRMVGMTLLLALGVLFLSVILTLTGILCRRRYNPARIIAWLVFSIVLIMFAGFLALAGITMLFNGERVTPMIIWSLLKAAGAGSLGLLGITLPFVVLAMSVSFYRQRLKALLRLPQEASPTMLRPVVEPAGAATR